MCFENTRVLEVEESVRAKLHMENPGERPIKYGGVEGAKNLQQQ